MVIEAYINTIFLHDPSCNINDFRSALLFCKDFLICFFVICIAIIKLAYMITKALFVHRFCMVGVRFASSYIQIISDITYVAVWFNNNSPGILLSSGNIFMVIGLLQMVAFFGIIFQICHIIGNLMLSAKRCLRIEKLEKQARAGHQSIVEIYGKKKYGDLEHKVYEENARISSPLFKGDYKEMFYFLSDGNECILEDIEAEFGEDEYPNDGHLDNIEDPVEEGITSREIDYEEYNINRFDAIGSDNLKLFIKMFKIHIANEERIAAEKIKQDEQAIRELILRDVRRLEADRAREERKAKMKAYYLKTHPNKNV